MEYLVENHKFRLDYSELKELYEHYASCSDDEFFSNLPKVLHLCCIIGYLKNTPNSWLLNDRGLIHEIAHFMDGVEETTSREDIRKDFNLIMKLS